MENTLSKEKNTINWFYYLLLFLYLCVLSFLHFSVAPFTGYSLWIYGICLFLQASLETLLLLTVALFLKRRKRQIFYYGFVSFIFLLLLFHLVHFMMIRLMDSSISYVFKAFFSTGIANFFLLLRAINMNYLFMILAFIGIVLLPFLGIVFYYCSGKILKKRPCTIALSKLIATQFLILTSILCLEKWQMKNISQNQWNFFQKTMPLGSCFLSYSYPTLDFTNTLQRPTAPQKVLQKLQKKKKHFHQLPNIYLFIIEALRKDCISSEIMPHIAEFKKECLTFDKTFANANATCVSWYTLFHASFPFHWKYHQQNFSTGSPILAFFQDLGYEICVISSAELPYYQMDTVLFGKDHKLAHYYHNYTQKNPALRDKKCFDLLQEKTKQQGQLFIVFLDSTHSEYSWLEDNFTPPFQPFSNAINYVKLSLTQKDLLLTKNRYYNAAYFLDHLFGNFFQFLKNNNLYDDAIVMLTGDHGEEFSEEGALFHGTHLNFYQLSVPILYKFKNPLPVQATITSHMDIFPSLLHYLSNQEIDGLEGKSIFSSKHKDYIIAAQQNAGLAPEKIALIDKETITEMRLCYEKDLYITKKLQILSHHLLQNTKESKDFYQRQQHIAKELSFLFSP